MHTYILRGKYSPDAFDGMLNDPSDRAPAAQALVEAIGGKMLGMYYSVSSSEVKFSNLVSIVLKLSAAKSK